MHSCGLNTVFSLNTSLVFQESKQTGNVIFHDDVVWLIFSSFMQHQREKSTIRMEEMISTVKEEPPTIEL